MKIGTRSILFGVHQFLWHPLTVAFAWRRVYRRWPNWWESICIFCHDLGYWGCDEMDGPEGKRHPIRGAKLAYRVVNLFLGPDSPLPARAYWLTLYHSSSLSRMENMPPSRLYLPDKVSVLYDPEWFYLLRANLSGEIHEYLSRSPFVDTGFDRLWYQWYVGNVKQKLERHEKNITRNC